VRRLAIVVPVVIVIIVAAVLAVGLLNVDKYRPRIQSELEKKLNRQVTLGRLSLKIIPLSLAVENVTISEAPGFGSTQPFATAKNLYVSAGLFSLLRGNPEVKSIRLDQPQIELIRNAQGVWNFSTLGGGSKQISGAGTESNELTLDELKMTDGQVAVTDQSAGQARAIYNGIDVNLTGFGPRKRFGLGLAAHLPGAGKELIQFKGNAGPLEPGNMADLPVTGHVSIQEVNLAEVNRFVSGGIPQIGGGVASGDANISSEQQALSAKGNLKLENAVIRGSKLAYPIDAQYDLTDNRKTGQLQIRSGNVKLGPTAFSLSGEANTDAKPVTLNVHVSTKDSSITELAQLAGSFGVAFNPSYRVKGNITADITATGAATAPQLSGSIDARQLQVSGGEIKEPVSVPQLSLALAPDVVHTISPFTAQSGSTSLIAAFALQHYTSKAMNVDATIKTANANIADLLNMAKAYGLDSSKGATGTGKLSLDAHVQGPTSSPSQLVYSGTANISGATLSAPSLTKPVSIASANVHFAQNSAAIDGLSASIGGTTVHGTMSAKNFAAPQVQFALTADKIDTDELQGLTAGPAHSNKTASRGKTQASNQPSMLEKMTGGGTLAANSVKAQELVLTNVRATCKLDRGVVTLSPLTAGVFGGSENGTVSVDTRPATALCSVKTKLAGVDTNALLSAISSVKNTLYGTLSADANLGFALASSTELTRTLNGTLAFNVANGQLKNVNILNEVSKVAKFLNAAPTQSGNNTDLKKLSGTLAIRNGVATTNNLIAALDAASLSGVGSLNLVDQGIDMRTSIVLGSGPSQSVGGTHVGGFMNTALANNKGELVIPVMVTGSLAHPTFTPDMQALAKMKLSNLLPSSGNPGSLVTGIAGALAGKKGAGGILNGILGGGQPAPAQPGANPAQQQQNPLDSILKGFGKKKDTKQ